MWIEIFKFELRYRSNRLDTYLYFFIIFIFSMIAIDFIYEGSLDEVKVNAPYVIAFAMSIVTTIFSMITSMIMGVAGLRDFDHNMISIMFTSPVSKKDYLLGRFLGSFFTIVLIFSGLLLGMILNHSLPWREAENVLPFELWYYVHPFVSFVLPTLFFTSAIFFVSGALTRKLLIVYTQGIFLFFIYQISIIIAQQTQNKLWVTLLDPFSFYSISQFVAFWTIAERNTLLIPLQGAILYNRILWILIGCIALILGYKYFNVDIRNGKQKQNSAPRDSIEKSIPTKIPRVEIRRNLFTGLNQLIHQSFFFFRTITKEIAFWAIVLCGMLIIILNSISLGTSFGVDSLPTTYLIVEELQEMSIYFFLMILIFYSGQLIWYERDHKIDLITDPLPFSGFVNLFGKYFGLLLTYLLVLIFLMLGGILFQAANGYFKYNIAVYFTGFFIDLLPFLALYTIISFALQIIVNHKYLAHLCVVLFFIFFVFLEAKGYNHGLYSFAGDNLGKYSEMNGYGHFFNAYGWFKLYWLLIGAALLIFTGLFLIRGKDTGFGKRISLLKERMSGEVKISMVIIFFLLSSVGAYIFYNTNILNTYWTVSSKQDFRIKYEIALKPFEYLPQPKVVDVNLKVDLFPKERKYMASGKYKLLNKTNGIIKSIHIQKRLDDNIELGGLTFSQPGKFNLEYESLGYRIYELEHHLYPGDSISLNFKQSYQNLGFKEDNNSNTEIIHNGTFFNSDHFPSLGYNKGYEIEDAKLRATKGLPQQSKIAGMHNLHELVNGRSGGDGYEINFDIVLSTDTSQIAIAPGKMINMWQVGDRRNYHYKMENRMVNFYAIVSADYEVSKSHWVPPLKEYNHQVDLEVYHHKGHDLNVGRMVKSMHNSLDYFTKQFGPYPYDFLRIMEFPRYRSFAQSFPGTIPFSEALGFIMDIQDDKDADMVFYITAHEIAHQWWGLQVIVANVEGRSMILESLAQYSALMVMRHYYSEKKVQKILNFELERYLRGRTSQKDAEVPLYRAQGQQYIHYSKGALSLYALQAYIGEDKVNAALRNFVKDWNAFGVEKPLDRYATSKDLIAYFDAVTPDSCKYLIDDLINTITLYDNKIISARYQKHEEKKFKIDVLVNVSKYRVDSLGIASPLAFNEWIEIVIYGEDKNGHENIVYLQKHKLKAGSNRLEILIDQLPTKIGLDPFIKLIDRNLKDNLKKISVIEVR